MSPRARYLVTTLALLTIAVGFTVTRGWLERPKPQRPAVTTSRPAPRPAEAPAARELLARADALGLDASQRARLEDLDRAWRAQTASLEAELATATAEFETFMREAQGSKGASLAEIQRRSAAVQELSAELRERRRLHAAAAAALLNDRQRTALASTGSRTTEGGQR